MITKQTATAEEVREAFLIPDVETAVKEITGIIDSQLDMDDLMEACVDASKGVLEKDAKMLERLMCFVRQAYLLGFAHAAFIHYEAAEQGYKALFCGKETGKPNPLSAEEDPLLTKIGGDV